MAATAEALIMWMVPEWAIGVGTIILAISVAKGIQHVIRSFAERPTRDGLSEQQAAHLTEVLDEVQRRLGELEERVDFTERLLARSSDAERLPPPPRTGNPQSP